MFICRLFHRDRPFEQIEARLLADGATTVGRDPNADWPLPDPEATLSRLHCTLTVENDRLFLRDTSTNGTLVEGEPVVRDTTVELRSRQSLHLGSLIIVVDKPSQGDAVGAATTLHAGLEIGRTPVPDRWIDGAQAPVAHRDGPLIEAFCEGAGLDVSGLSGEEPHELMRRVGAIYQQTVLGLATLMSDRARVKSQADLDRTTIAASANNPIKWTPSRKLGQALLSGNQPGFMAGEDAVRASFEDLGRHMAALAEGANAAANLTARTLAPDTIDAEAREQASLLRSLHVLRWETYLRRYNDLVAGDGDNALRRAFIEAYARSADDRLP
jgi:predicted component of type VI protein secretion system